MTRNIPSDKILLQLFPKSIWRTLGIRPVTPEEMLIKQKLLVAAVAVTYSSRRSVRGWVIRVINLRQRVQQQT